MYHVAMSAVVFCLCMQANDHRISVKLDISAPHIILPENFHDRETAMVGKRVLNTC